MEVLGLERIIMKLEVQLRPQLFQDRPAFSQSLLIPQAALSQVAVN
jgi:hypothetical protein